MHYETKRTILLPIAGYYNINFATTTMSEPPPQRRSSRVPTKRKRLAEPLSDDDSDVELDFKKHIKQMVIKVKKMKLDFDDLVRREEIDLYSKGLVDDDLDVLYQVIEQSTVLEKLDVGVNHLTLADGKFANAIGKNTTIKRLWLTDNNINVQGTRHLANALKENITPLKDLDLAGNIIGDEGAEYIADVLAVSKSIQKIYLGKNNIGDKGAESIAASLVLNTGIREIYLDWNNITDMGVQKLADALESNHNIRTLDSSHNKKISKDVRGRINTILKDPKRNNNDQVVTPSDNDSTSININNRSSSSSFGARDEQMMDASQKAKQSSASSSLTRGSISDEKMPASNNKRGTAKSTANDGLVVTQGPNTSRELKVAKGLAKRMKMKFNFDEFDKLVKQKDIYLYNEGLQDDELGILYKVIEQSAVLDTLYLKGNKLTLADGKLINAIAKSTTIKRFELQ